MYFDCHNRIISQGQENVALTVSTCPRTLIFDPCKTFYWLFLKFLLFSCFIWCKSCHCIALYSGWELPVVLGVLIFEWKSVKKFQSLCKISNISTSDPQFYQANSNTDCILSDACKCRWPWHCINFGCLTIKLIELMWLVLLKIPKRSHIDL